MEQFFATPPILGKKKSARRLIGKKESYLLLVVEAAR